MRALILTLLMLAAVAARAGVTETTHGDWTVRCSTEAPKQCEMMQAVYADEAKTQRALLAVVGLPSGSMHPGMILMLPLGISLPPGTFVSVDAGENIRVPVERCERGGCRIEMLITPDFLKELKAGVMMVVLAHDRDRKMFSIGLSLVGFKEAFEKVDAL